MADAATVSVLIQARDQASAQFQKIEGNMGKMAAGFAKHRRAIGLAATAIGGAITGIAAMSVKSSFDQQQGIRSLDQALKNVGTSYAAQKKQIEALASAQQIKTNFGDEEQRKALQELIQVSGSYDDAMAAMIPTMDLAAAKEMDLGAAATLVARAISGEETALGRYGVEVEKGAGSTAVLTKIMEKFGGQAEANADPMIQLKNRVGDLFQVLGDNLLPVLETLLPMIEKTVRRIIEWTEAHPTLTKVLALAATAIGGILLVVGPLLLLLPTIAASIGILSGAFIALNLSMGPVTLVIIAVAVAIAAAILIWKNWDKIIAIVKKGVALFVKGFVEYIKMFAKAASAIVGFIPRLDGLKKKIDEGIGKLDNMADGMEDWAQTGQRSFSEVGSAATESERKLALAAEAAQEDMGGMGAASETMAAGVKTSTDKVQTSFKETTEVVTASMRGWGFEIDKATGITEEMAVRTATATRNIAEAFQEAGDTAMTESQKIAAAQRKLSGELKTEMDKRDKYFEDSAAQAIKSTKFMEEQIKITLTEDLEEDFSLNLEMMKEWGLGTKKVFDEVPKALGEALDKIPPLLGEADFQMQKRLQSIRDSVTSTMFGINEDIEGLSSAEAKDATGREEKKAQAAIAQFKQTPQFASMSAQRKALSGAESGLASAEKRYSNQQERLAIIRANAPSGPGSSTMGHPENQRRINYWANNTRPNMDALRDLGDTVNQAKERVEILRSNVAAQRIPEHLVSAFQGGGISGGGLALVGERGPEVVSLPGGARVHPSGAGPGTNNFIFHGAVYGLEDLRRVVVEAVRDHALSGGFRGVFGEA